MKCRASTIFTKPSTKLPRFWRHFLGAASGGELPEQKLIDVAYQVVDDLTVWRESLEEVVRRDYDAGAVH